MSSAGFRVRVAGLADLGEIVALERAIPEAPHWAEAEYAAIFNSISAVSRCLFVAEAEERLLGFSVGKVVSLGEKGFADLESVAVSVVDRRGGVGRALCAAVIDWGVGQKATVLELEVRAGNSGALALYAELGFIAVGRRRGYYKDPAEDAVMMRLELVKNK